MTKQRTGAKSPAVDVAKEMTREDRKVVTLSTGVRAVLKPVAAALVDEVTSRIKDPEVPMWHNPDKDRDELKPDDPQYLKDVREADRKRGMAALDAMIVFGIELVDGLPEDDEWLDKLRWMEKRGTLDLSSYDLDDPIEREFVYKRFVAVSAADLMAVTRSMGVPEEDVARAMGSFPSSAT